MKKLHLWIFAAVVFLAAGCNQVEPSYRMGLAARNRYPGCEIYPIDSWGGIPRVLVRTTSGEVHILRFDTGTDQIGGTEQAFSAPQK